MSGRFGESAVESGNNVGDRIGEIGGGGLGGRIRRRRGRGGASGVER